MQCKLFLLFFSGIVSYTMPQGNSLTVTGVKTLKFQDDIYDGDTTWQNPIRWHGSTN